MIFASSREIPMQRWLSLMSVLVLMLVTPALAAGGADAELVANARDMLAGIERDVTAFEELAAQSTAVGSEERALLERRKVRAGADVLARINEVVEAVVELEREGSQVPDLREAAVGLVLRIDPLARKRIDDLNAEITVLGVERDRSEGEARGLVEARIVRRAELLRKLF